MPEAKHDDNVRYDTPDYWYVREVMRVLALTPDDVFYDVGSGMGRILCVAARHRLKRCVGIELSNRLCSIGRENARRLRGRRSPVEILWCDAARAPLDGGTVYFLFNPFGAGTMHDFLENLRRSLQAEPRAVRVVYYNCVHRDLLDSCDWLDPYHEFQTSSGLAVVFWRGPQVRQYPSGNDNSH